MLCVSKTTNYTVVRQEGRVVDRGGLVVAAVGATLSTAGSKWNTTPVVRYRIDPCAYDEPGDNAGRASKRDGQEEVVLVQQRVHLHIHSCQPEKPRLVLGAVCKQESSKYVMTLPMLRVGWSTCIRRSQQ